MSEICSDPRALTSCPFHQFSHQTGWTTDYLIVQWVHYSPTFCLSSQTALFLTVPLGLNFFTLSQMKSVLLGETQSSRHNLIGMALVLGQRQLLSEWHTHFRRRALGRRDSCTRSTQLASLGMQPLSCKNGWHPCILSGVALNVLQPSLERGLSRRMEPLLLSCTCLKHNISLGVMMRNAGSLFLTGPYWKLGREGALYSWIYQSGVVSVLLCWRKRRKKWSWFKYHRFLLFTPSFSRFS